MPGRIRTIKPEILDDEKTAGLSDTASRMLEALILLADDHGNLRGNMAWIVSQVWWAHAPAIDPSVAMAELLTSKLCERYHVRGQSYICITNWTRHQNVQRPGNPRVPRPCDADNSGNDSEQEAHIPASHTALDSDPQTANPNPPNPPLPCGGEKAHEFNNQGTIPGTLTTDLRSPITDPNKKDVRLDPEPTGSSQPTLPNLNEDAPTDSATQPHGYDAERDVFDHWLAGWKITIHGIRTPKLSPDRRRKIRARLREGWVVADLKSACDGLWHSTWHIENGQTDIELVCRDTRHVEMFLAKLPAVTPVVATNPARHDPAPESEADIIARAEVLERERLSSSKRRKPAEVADVAR